MQRLWLESSQAGYLDKGSIHWRGAQYVNDWGSVHWEGVWTGQANFFISSLKLTNHKRPKATCLLCHYN